MGRRHRARLPHVMLRMEPRPVSACPSPVTVSECVLFPLLFTYTENQAPASPLSVNSSECVMPLSPKCSELANVLSRALKSISSDAVLKSKTDFSYDIMGACMLSRFSRVQLCNPMDSSLPGSSDRGILQARMLEWVAMPFSRGSSQPRDRTLSLFCLLRWQGGSLPLVPPGKPCDGISHIHSGRII